MKHFRKPNTNNHLYSSEMFVVVRRKTRWVLRRFRLVAECIDGERTEVAKLQTAASLDFASAEEAAANVPHGLRYCAPEPHEADVIHGTWM